MMTLAIMQPYLFPYIGYFQLLAAVDKFVLYDDVAFIKQGWINRNAILVNGNRSLFSVPLKQATSFKRINEIVIAHTYPHWVSKFEKTLISAYKKAPYFEPAFAVVMNTLRNAEVDMPISELCRMSVLSVKDYLAMDKDIVTASEKYENRDLAGSQRVIDICIVEKADKYVNASGGIELYSKESFKEVGIDLLFLNTDKVEYQQFGNEFVASLSIIDVLMFNSIEQLKVLLTKYHLN